MKFLSLQQLLIGALGFLLLGILFVKAQLLDSDFYSTSSAILNDTKQYDAALNEAVLKVKAGRLRNYDSLVADMNELTEARRQLTQNLDARSNDINPVFTRELYLQLDALENTLQYKSNLLEEFKTQAAILQNSLHYLSEHTDLVLATARRAKSPDTMNALFDKLITDILHYAVVPQPEVAKRITSTLKRTRNEMQGRFATRDQKILEQVLGHIQLILDKHNRVEKVLDRLLSVPVLKIVKSLTLLYESIHYDNLRVSSHYRLYLYIAAIAMLFYIGYIFVRMKMSGEDLGKALQELKYMQFAMDQHAIVSIADVKGDITYVNDKFMETSDYELDELLGKNHRIVNSGYHPQSYFKELWQKISSGQVWHGEIRDRRKNGDFYWVDCTIVPFKDAAGKPYKYVSIRTDITELKNTQNELFREKERAQITLASIGEGVVTVDTECKVNYLNPKAEQLIGWALERVTGQKLPAIFNIDMEADRGTFDETIEDCLRYGRASALPGNPKLTSRNGTSFFVEVTIAPLCDKRDRVLGAVLVFRDVTELRALARKITHQARHDALTGLVNRSEFERHLRRIVVATAGREKSQHALCYVDLDQFKVVNDTCGHAAGDELLRQLASLLRGKIRSGDIIGRLGGDEFGLILKDCSTERAEHIGYEVCCLVKDFRYVWQDKTFQVGASIGIVPIVENSGSVETVLTLADTACYMAKDLGRNRVHVYREHDAEIQARSNEMQWVPRIAQALTEDRFCLYAQAIMPIKNQDTLAPHYEILIRMRDENGVLVPPGAFFSAAERYDLMPAIDHWVIDNSLRIYSSYIRSRHDGLEPHCAINLSGASLNDPNLGQFIQKQLDIHGVAPHLICFEITETVAVTNMARVVDFIKNLKRLGCQFALDDFGSGLSSFGYLKNLPVDYLKIDGNFVRDAASNPIDRAMVASINQVGHVMGLKTVAEFVEDEETLAVLCEIGIDFAQGFGVSRPQPIEEQFSSKPNHLSLVANRG